MRQKVLELRNQGFSRKEANELANKWIKKQAALHNPDQIAGGNPLKIDGLGNAAVNSFIGSQWKCRIDIVDEKCLERDN